MQKSFTKLCAVLCILLACAESHAQDAMVRGNDARRHAGMISLREMFTALENNLQVGFSYSAAQVEGKWVADRFARIPSAQLDEQLAKALVPAGLQAVRISAHDYAIRTIASPTASKTADLSVSGLVTDADGQPLPGVSVHEKGTSNGTATNNLGRYSIRVAGAASVLVFRSVGFVTQEKAAGRGDVNITLVSDVKELNSVVVTALGIKREEKALGYSIATLKGDQVATVKEVNVANALSAKVSGVNVRAVSSDPGASVFVTIRGQRSLQGDNNPMYVVDGVPIAGGVRSPKEPVGRGVVDYGSPISDINPDDIATVTVLKGASASALYGTRALNGVILITTKSGSGAKKGLGVSVNSSAMFDRAWLFPQFQNEFGSGNRPGTTETISTASWGPRLDIGTKHVQWDSPLDGSGNRIPTDWVSYPDRQKDFYQTGFTLTNNIAITGANKDGDFRLSYTNLTNEGIVPNTDLKRNTLNLSAGYVLHPKVKVSTNVGYTNNKSDNRPTFNRESASNIVYTTTPNVDVKKLRNYWLPGEEGRKQYSHVPGTVDNPFFVAYEFINGFNRDRLLGNVEVNIELAKGLTLMGRTAMDTYNEIRESKRPFGSVRNPIGAYSMETEKFTERNTDFLLTYQRHINTDFFFSIAGGANRMHQKGQSTFQGADALSIPKLYNIGNAAAGSVRNTTNFWEQRINSVYGMGQVSFRNYLFLDLTARNDWASPLPSNNNSYFYPSVSLGWVISDMLKIQSGPLNFAKIRANWAQVGGKPDPHQLYNTFLFGQDWNTAKKATQDATLLNNNLKPLIATSTEIGADFRFFNGRLGLDVTWYNAVTSNQFIRIGTTMASGYNQKLINGGEIRNRGIEATITGTPVKGAFQWDVSANFTRNRNKVLSLGEGMKEYILGSSEGVQFEARVGEEMGNMYARSWATVPDGEHKGEPLINDGGEYTRLSVWTKIGNFNPDYQVGFSNTFSYKGFALNVLIDWRQGGQFHSYVAKNLLSDGRTKTTLPGRDQATGGLAWTDGSGERRNDGSILYGYVYNDATGKYEANTQILDPEAYYGTYYWDYLSRSTFDATYVKLREASLTYNFPKKILGRLPISNLNFSLIARNLFTWTAADMGYDPETAMTVSNNAIGQGVGSWSLPYTRSFGAKLGFNF